MLGRDVIGIVETAYDLSLTSAGFNAALIDASEGLLPANTLPAAYGFHRGPKGEVVIRNLVSRDARVVRAFSKSWRLADLDGGGAEIRHPIARQIFRRHWRLLSSSLLGSEAMRAPVLRVACLDFPNTKDIFLISSHDRLGDAPGVAIAAGRHAVAPLAPAETARWQRIRAHLRAAVRLRWNFERRGLSLREPTKNGAVVHPAGRVVHASGRATEPDARAALQRAAVEVDRSRMRGLRSSADALELWKALVLGEWSLVERFDSDGKRLYVAHQNAEGVTDPRGLTVQEARVSAFAARGLSNKLIAYSLGISLSTVATHLSSAQRKLGCGSRASFIQQLAPHYPTVERRGWIEKLAFKGP